MEVSEHGFLEEVVCPRREESNKASSSTMVVDHFFSTSSSNSWSLFDEEQDNPFLGFSTLLQQQQEDHFISSQNNNIFNSNNNNININNELINCSFSLDPPQIPIFPLTNFEDELIGCCKIETFSDPKVVVLPSFNLGAESGCGVGERNGLQSQRPKKLQGQPSKNLMAERRRRKRLNDRLSMLRSIVPKISKMDRTSILGDTIDYMKELLERINKLKEGSTNFEEEIKLLGISKDLKPDNNEVLVRNSPKFDVERRELETRIDICCAGKPGLLISTVNTIESLGLDIQHCVISCFNDFSLQASCSEVGEQRSLVSCEDIKQAIFRNAGYAGGRCL